MSSQYTGENEDFEEDEEQNSFSFISSVSGTLCVVDCSEEMLFKDPATGISRVELSLEAIKNTYCNRLIGGSHDYIGVLLCGTDTKTNDYPGLHILLPLDAPDKSCVETLERLISAMMSGKYEFGNSHAYSPYHLLWTCNSVYTSCVKKLGNRQVMMFTNVAEPHNLDPKTRQLATTKARDMSELGITISLIVLPTNDGGEFEMEKFYSSLVPDQETTKPTNDIEDLSTRVHRRENKLRMTTSIPFVVGEELTIGVQCCNLFGDTTAVPIKMCRKTNEPVVVVSTQVRESDRALLLPHEVYRSYQLGGKKLVFSADEVDQMKVRTDKGVYLIGFRSAADIKLHHVAGKAAFMRPCETVYAGSGQFFMALLMRCVSREMVGLCHCVPREGSVGYIAALVPQPEQRDQDNEQIRAAGFHLIRLPFAEDIKKLEYEPTIPASTKQVEAAKAMVMKLKAKYSASLIENPRVQQFQKTLEAIALERDSIEETEDLTKPDISSIDKRAYKEMKLFNSSIYLNGLTIPEECKKTDYKAIIANVTNRQREGNLSKVTASDLRLFCKGARVKVPSNAKKADLLVAIKKFIG